MAHGALHFIAHPAQLRADLLRDVPALDRRIAAGNHQPLGIDEQRSHFTLAESIGEQRRRLGGRLHQRIVVLERDVGGMMAHDSQRGGDGRIRSALLRHREQFALSLGPASLLEQHESLPLSSAEMPGRKTQDRVPGLKGAVEFAEIGVDARDEIMRVAITRMTLQAA